MEGPSFIACFDGYIRVINMSVSHPEMLLCNIPGLLHKSWQQFLSAKNMEMWEMDYICLKVCGMYL
jgi:hypothetical protein